MLTTLEISNCFISGIPPNHFPALRKVVFMSVTGQEALYNLLPPTIETVEFHNFHGVDRVLQRLFPRLSEGDADITMRGALIPLPLPSFRNLTLVQCTWMSFNKPGELLDSLLRHRQTLHLESDGWKMASSGASLLSLKERYGDRVEILENENISSSEREGLSGDEF
jgi:hypothetical protein